MNKFAGISVKQFKDAIEEMRTVYPFTDENAHLSNCVDLFTGEVGRRVEVATTDERTGVHIVMEKVIQDEKGEGRYG